MRFTLCSLLCVGIMSVTTAAWTADDSLPKQVPRRNSSQLSSGFGVNLPLPRDPHLPWTRHWWTRLFDSGVKWVRLGQYENSSDKTSWDWVEQTPGNYQVLPEVDEAIRSLLDNDVSIEVQLCYNNALYQGDRSRRPTRIQPAPPGVGDNDNPAHSIFTPLNTEDSLAAFLSYTHFMVNRFKGKVKGWELWNEPNIGYWQPNVELKVDRAAKGREYGRALCRFADVVHEEDPQAKVIFGGTSTIDAAFALAAIANCPEKIDIMAYHVYPGYGANHAPEEGDALEDAGLFREAVLRIPGVRKDIEFWDNEWNTIPTWKNSSESVQAAYLPRYYLQARAQNVEGFFWEFIPGTDGNEGDQFGLIHGDTPDRGFQPRPAYRSFEVTAALFGQTQVDGAADIRLEAPDAHSHGQLRKYAYRDRMTGKRIYAVWLAVPSDPDGPRQPIPMELGIPGSGIENPILIDLTSGNVTALHWKDKEKQHLLVPVSDEAVAVADASYLHWPPAPGAPGELLANSTGNEVRLQWHGYGSATGFEVHRSVDWGPWQKAGTVPEKQTNFSEPIPQGQHVSYRVRALGQKATSAWSNPAWIGN
jgi:hypothetical protein